MFVTMYSVDAIDACMPVTVCRTVALQFGTPKRTNRSRLSGDMTSSLSLAQRRTEDGSAASDSERKSLGGASTTSNKSQLEFLKYHKSASGARERSSRADAANSDTAQRRGHDYWKQQIEQNDNDLAHAPAHTEHLLSESGMREQILRESDARIATDRHMGL